MFEAAREVLSDTQIKSLTTRIESEKKAQKAAARR
jgi:hypothetical protein